MSLEQIGSGKPALVFVYDPNLSVSIKQSEEINKTRDQFGQRVLFLVAKVGTPQGDQLIVKQSARSAELMLFDSSGTLVRRALALKKASELTSMITTSNVL